MEAEEYERAIAQVTLPAFALTYQTFQAVHPQPVTDESWLALLRTLFEVVREQASRAAEIARDFYDAERQRQVPGVPIQPLKLASLSFENFVKDMEPARKLVKRENFSPEHVAMRAATSVENGARRTIIHAVDNPDPDLDQFVDEEEVREVAEEAAPRQARRSLIRGWARVPTGAETCGFCWMLASRGPVFKNSWSAGARVGDQAAVQRTADGSFTAKDMNQWHPNCDCKVVPVFREGSWPGKDKSDAAWQLWKDEIQNRYSGKEALNAFRRLIEGGALQRFAAPVAA